MRYCPPYAWSLTLPSRAVFAPLPTHSATLCNECVKHAAVQLSADMPLCAAAAALTKAKLEFRYYPDIQPQEAAEFARMLELNYFDFKTQQRHQEMASELAAALEGSIKALLKFVYNAACKLLRRSPLAHCH